MMKKALKFILLTIMIQLFVSGVNPVSSTTIGRSTDWPNVATCEIFTDVSTDGMNWRGYAGSGCFVDDNIVLTADHVVFPEGRPVYFKVTVIPARDGWYKPFGEYKVITCIHASDRFDSPTYDNDWCLLVLERGVPCSQYPIRAFDNSPEQLNSALGIPVCTIGYPDWCADYMHRVDGRIEEYEYTNNNLFIASLNTSPGCSGGPLLDSESRVLGIAVAKYDSFPLTIVRRIDRSLYNIIVDAIHNYP